MTIFETYQKWMAEHDFIAKLIHFVFWVLLILVITQLLKRYLVKKIPSGTTRYKSQKGVQVIGYVLILFLSIFYFTGNIKDFTLAIGLISAGIAFTLQELFLSIAGSIYIFTLKVFKPGDRIEINGIKGDVIDVDSIYTTMMEIGEWVDSDNYSGRIVKVSNAFIFKSPVYNYSQDFPFVWDVVNIPIHHESDHNLARSIVQNIAKDILQEFTDESKAKWKDIVQKYYIEDAQLDPTISMRITDNWMELNLRYIVDYKKRRITKNLLFSRISEEFKASNGKVKIGSTSLDILSAPNISVKLNH